MNKNSVPPCEDPMRSDSVRLHLGCGTVYLDGYVNIDAYRPGFSFLANDRPDLVAENLTTLDRYYKVMETKETLELNLNQPRYVVADRFADILELDYDDNSVDEIVLVQTLEHFTRQEGERLLGLMYRILKPAGRLHIDVPDFEETARQLLLQQSEVDKDWYYRLIYGSQKDTFSLHKDGYSYEKLRLKLEKCGFKRVRRVPNTRHGSLYPVVIAECEK
jgi:SAM-dependent methyltransferase